MEDPPALLYIEYKGTILGRISVDKTEKGYKIGRVDIKESVDEKDIALVLCMNLPLYQNFIISSKPCELERLWGWGVPYCQMIHCANQCVKEWHRMTPKQFRNRVIEEFVKWGAEIDIPNIDRYGTIMNSMIQVIYEINTQIKYLNKK